MLWDKHLTGDNSHVLSPSTYSFQLLNLFLRLQLAKLLQEGEVRGKGLWLKEVQETEELIYAVLERSACEQHTMLLWWEAEGRGRKRRGGGRGGGGEGEEEEGGG